MNENHPNFPDLSYKLGILFYLKQNGNQSRKEQAVHDSSLLLLEAHQERMWEKTSHVSLCTGNMGKCFLDTEKRRNSEGLFMW